MKLNRTKVTVLLTLVVPCLVLFVVDQMGQSKCLSVKLPTKEVVLKFEYSQVESDLPERVIAAPEWVKSILSIDEINISQIPLYLEHNLKDTLTLTSPSDDNKKVSISNLKDFIKYKKLGYYAFTTVDISLSSNYLVLLQFFELLQRCKFVSNTSNDSLDKIISTLKVGELPDLIADEEKDLHKDDTIQEYISNDAYETDLTDGNFTITKKNPEFDISTSWSFCEIQRADFSNSGCEEILVLCHYQSGGTLNFCYPLLIRHIAESYDKVNIKYPDIFD